MAESPIAPAHCDVVCAPESPQEDAPTTIPSAGATLGTQTAARPDVSVGATSTAQWLESPIASGPGLLPTATTTSMVAPPESPPMGLPAHRYAATTQLPIVPASDGGWEWGSPDDRRAHNQGTDRWQRLGPIPAVKRQEWARMVLLCWGNRATERAKDQPVDFVREVVEDKMRDQSKERREQVIRNLRSWVETPESRAKLRLDAACEYRQKLADRHKLPDDWAGWFPAMEQKLVDEWDRRQNTNGRRITEFWMCGRARRLVRELTKTLLAAGTGTESTLLRRAQSFGRDKIVRVYYIHRLKFGGVALGVVVHTLAEGILD